MKLRIAKALRSAADKLNISVDNDGWLNNGIIIVTSNQQLYQLIAQASIDLSHLPAENTNNNLAKNDHCYQSIAEFVDDLSYITASREECGTIIVY